MYKTKFSKQLCPSFVSIEGCQMKFCHIAKSTWFTCLRKTHTHSTQTHINTYYFHMHMYKHTSPHKFSKVAEPHGDDQESELISVQSEASAWFTHISVRGWSVNHTQHLCICCVIPRRAKRWAQHSGTTHLHPWKGAEYPLQTFGPFVTLVKRVMFTRRNLLESAHSQVKNCH